MENKTQCIQVLMSDGSILNVRYLCKPDLERKKRVKLVIQMKDCVCSLEMESKGCTRVDMLETLVQEKVKQRKGQ